MMSPEKKAALLKKYSLKETHGFEKKPEMETDVEEQLRNGYEAQKLQPYHSMLDKAKSAKKESTQKLKEEEMKAGKEAGSTTDVEEELRKNYAIGGKLAPYKPISQK
jgi:hypothetical protein